VFLISDTINNQMTQNTGQVNQLRQEMLGYGSQIRKAYQTTQQMKHEYTTLQAQVDKLNKINQMWSKNFKIMEVTFKQIQRNVKGLNFQSIKSP